MKLVVKILSLVVLAGTVTFIACQKESFNSSTGISPSKNASGVAIDRKNSCYPGGFTLGFRCGPWCIPSWSLCDGGFDSAPYNASGFLGALISTPEEVADYFRTSFPVIEPLELTPDEQAALGINQSVIEPGIYAIVNGENGPHVVFNYKNADHVDSPLNSGNAYDGAGQTHDLVCFAALTVKNEGTLKGLDPEARFDFALGIESEFYQSHGCTVNQDQVRSDYKDFKGLDVSSPACVQQIKDLSQNDKEVVQNILGVLYGLPTGSAKDVNAFGNTVRNFEKGITSGDVKVDDAEAVLGSLSVARNSVYYWYYKASGGGGSAKTSPWKADIIGTLVGGPELGALCSILAALE